jgi:hypothetical protein
MIHLIIQEIHDLKLTKNEKKQKMPRKLKKEVKKTFGQHAYNKLIQGVLKLQYKILIDFTEDNIKYIRTNRLCTYPCYDVK